MLPDGRAKELRRIAGAVSLATPGVRMVVVAVAYYEKDDEHDSEYEVIVYPVVAIQVVMRHTVVRGESRVDRPGTLEQALNSGWALVGSRLFHEPIVVGPMRAIADAGSAFADEPWTAWDAFVADWPAAEDEVRLAKEIEWLKERAKFQWDSYRLEQEREADRG